MTDRLQDLVRRGRKLHLIEGILGDGILIERMGDRPDGDAHQAAAILAFEHHARAEPRRLARADLHQCRMRVQDPFEQHLDAPAAVFAAEKPRRDDARVVEYQEITRAQERGEVPKAVIG